MGFFKNLIYVDVISVTKEFKVELSSKLLPNELFLQHLLVNKTVAMQQLQSHRLEHTAMFPSFVELLLVYPKERIMMTFYK